MNTFTLGIISLSLSSLLGLSETAPAVDYEARVKSVETLKQHIDQREARFDVLKQDLLGLDGRLEKQIDSIVKSLSSIKDSNDSKTRVANAKGDVIKSLVRTIWIYRQKRVEVFQRMRKESSVPDERLEVDLKVFDDRIDKRVEQVMELSRSFPGHEDVSKYESDGGSYYDGWYEENTRISEDWKQNRRNGNARDVLRRELLQTLEKALTTNQSRRAAIADTLDKRKISDDERKLQQKELGRLDAVIDNLKSQKLALALPSAGATKEVGGDEAHDTEQMLDDARVDLSRDFSDIMRKYGELDKERTRLFDLKNNLKTREEWLKNNLPSGEKTPEK
ncbi:MAG: hypothetical protein WCH40_01830 [Verrucomicrobiales bacterium]